MRDIKFRAWNKLEKEMEYFALGFIDKYLDGGSLEKVREEYYWLMQFIGEKDKHLKEIYEGDIVRVPWDYSGDYRYPECLAYVKYDKDCFLLVNPNDEHGVVHQDWWWKNAEVVGNIFENPTIIADYYDSKRLAGIVYNI